MSREAVERADDARSDAVDTMWRVKAGRTAASPPVDGGVLSLQALSGNKAVERLINVQRHSTTNAPPAPSKAGDDEEEVVQGLWNRSPSTAPVAPSLQRWPVKLGPSAKAKAVVGAPKIGGSRPPLGKIRLPGKSFPADGTTFQASIPGAKGRKIVWSLILGQGSTIDNTGKITTGKKILGGLEEMPVIVQATDDKGASSMAAFGLVDPKVFTARKEFPKFIGGGPYKFPKFRTFDKFGRFDVTYLPAAKQVNIDMKIAFRFRGIRLGAGRKHRAAQRAKRDAYANTIIATAKTAWSDKFKIDNVREPKSVWGKLGPVKVVFNPTRVNSRRQAHFVFVERSNRSGTANVTSTGRVTFFKGDDTDSPAFNPGTQNNELARLKKISPDLRFDPNTADLTAASKTSAAFLGLYLKRMNNPSVDLAITAHARNDKMAKSRGTAAIGGITAGGLAAPHTAKATPQVAKSGDTTKAEIAPSLPKGWQNVQGTTAHEFGHMLGLDDEYVRSGFKVGDKMGSYKLAEAALGKKWADTSHRITKDSSSVMEGGNDVRIQHYVTLWDALAQVSAKAAVPTPKFGQADWKLIG